MTTETQDPLVEAADIRDRALKNSKRSIDKEFVEVIREELERATVVEIAERLGMSRGGVHRLLRAYPEEA